MYSSITIRLFVNASILVGVEIKVGMQVTDADFERAAEVTSEGGAAGTRFKGRGLARIERNPRLVRNQWCARFAIQRDTQTIAKKTT
jgi:hypothetical protein